jgi:CheY-like chemotaxis protein
VRRRGGNVERASGPDAVVGPVLTILLAEDNESDQFLVSLALERSHKGTLLEIVDDGQQAMDYLLKRGNYPHAVRPALVILDFDMPRKTGAEVLMEIRNEPTLEGIAVALLTGSKISAELEAFCKLNSNFYIKKPYQLDARLGVITDLETYCLNVRKFPLNKHRYSDELRQSLPAA